MHHYQLKDASSLHAASIFAITKRSLFQKAEELATEHTTAQ